MSILFAIIALGALIFVHELGHFIFAKAFGVGVEKFSLGFGPKVIGKTIGETEYLISAFPLGGYVKMIGEGDDVELSEEDKHRSFADKHPLQRIVIVAAGPVFNLLSAYVLFIIIFMIGVPSATTKIGEVVPGKPAAVAGMKGGDVITAVNGKPVDRWDEFAKIIAEGKIEPLQIEVKRGQTPVKLTMTPESRTAKNILGDTVTQPIVGVVAAGETVIDHFPPAKRSSGGAPSPGT